MDFSMMTDDEVLAEIGKRFEKIRIQKQISDAELISKGGASKDALWRFRNGEPITTKNLIRILRGLDEFSRLEKMFHIEDVYRPSLDFHKIKIPKRVHAKNKNKKLISFVWGEDR